MSEGLYVTTSIPYVNARPHLGHALELVQADVLARHRRARGGSVRFLSGTDDNALKNVLAAREAGVSVDVFVNENASRFQDLVCALDLSVDDFIRTSTDPRHRPAVERLWRACEASGDLFLRDYEGLYCIGCEQFYDAEELADGRCAEHGVPPEVVTERNWFFRLSRYETRLRELVESGELRIELGAKRNEVLSFIKGGLEDVSVSRQAERAQGWGIPVPGDPGQVVYVWFDALANYISALGYGSAGADYATWWQCGGERTHVIGKGILRFHAVLWPALLLSAGVPVPTTIFVHDYLTANGEKLSKSKGNAPDPAELIDRFGVDAVRWWLLSDVPRLGDADFTVRRLIDRYNADLAGGIGNLVARVATLAQRSSVDTDRVVATTDLSGRISSALEAFDFRRAIGAVLEAVAETNRGLESVRPWELPPGDPTAAAAIERALDVARHVARELGVFLPSASARLIARLDGVGEGIRPLPRLAF